MATLLGRRSTSISQPRFWSSTRSPLLPKGMGNMITKKCKKIVRKVLLKNYNRRQRRPAVAAPPVPSPPKMHCFLSTQIGLYIQQEGVLMPPTITGVPAGLEYLTLVNEIGWKKIRDPYELSLDAGTGHKYSIMNTNDDQIFFCFEKSSIYHRSFLGPYRSFNLHILDNFNREAVRLTRSVFSIGQEECRIESPPGTLIATVRRSSTWMKVLFTIEKDGEEKVVQLTGPGVLKQAWTEPIWKASLSSEEIGTIEKRRLGRIMEIGYEQDTIELSFSHNLDVKWKAILLGTSFLLDCFLLDTPKSPAEDSWSMLSTLISP